MLVLPPPPPHPIDHVGLGNRENNTGCNILKQTIYNLGLFPFYEFHLV